MLNSSLHKVVRDVKNDNFLNMTSFITAKRYGSAADTDFLC